ncbi:probable trehalose-phosphate phosphatase 9 isoform X2 [Daucus carota subsp. sativus]|uniref:probable trehalose-phosphate phosphatase 9 isoform X2 n=1 Tax=Daucus carota subsp. sativus TaxID=79200 RepID=UPI003082B200
MTLIVLSCLMHSAAKNAGKHFPTAIISGRRRDMVGILELLYAGSHGMDIRYLLRDTYTGSHGMDIRYRLRDTAEVPPDHIKSEKHPDQQESVVCLPNREVYYCG